jgi:hypothetical protein
MDLVNAENDTDRLAYYCGDVHEMAREIADICEPETANRIGAILAERFHKESLGGDISVPH